MPNTPNMNLLLPVIGIDSGLVWEQSINANSDVIDSHNHTPGSGVQITPLGLDINSNLSIQSNKLTNVFGVEFSAPAPSSLFTFLYTAPQSGGGVNDLFYNDGAGNIIPITKAGIVNAIASSIPGESYSAGTFTWVQGSGSTTPANFDIGSVTIRPNTAMTTRGVTLSPPSAIASAYSILLPLLPLSNLPVSLDASGNLTAALITGAQIVANANFSGAVIVGVSLQVTTGGPILTNSAGVLSISSDVASGGFISANNGVFPGAGSNAELTARNANTLSVKDPGSSSVYDIVVSPQSTNAGMVIIRGNIAANGTINDGFGFTVSKGATGKYTVTFSTTFFGTIPSVIASVNTAPGVANCYVANPGNISGSGFTNDINLQSGSVTVAQDQPWSFAVFAERQG